MDLLTGLTSQLTQKQFLGEKWSSSSEGPQKAKKGAKVNTTYEMGENVCYERGTVALFSYNVF